MTKTELVKVIAEKVEMKQKDVDAVLTAYADTVVDVLKEDNSEKVTFGNLGSFRVKEVGERRGIIQMGEKKGQEYVTPAHREIAFKMSKSAKTI